MLLTLGDTYSICCCSDPTDLLFEPHRKKLKGARPLVPRVKTRMYGKVDDCAGPIFAKKLAHQFFFLRLTDRENVQATANPIGKALITCTCILIS